MVRARPPALFTVCPRSHNLVLSFDRVCNGRRLLTRGLDVGAISHVDISVHLSPFFDRQKTGVDITLDLGRFLEGEPFPRKDGAVHLRVDDGLVRHDSSLHLAARSYFDPSRVDGAGDQTADNEDLVRLSLFG